MRQSLRVLTIAAVCLFAVTAGVPAIAQDVGVDPDKTLAKELKNLADTCYKCGESAREKGIFTYARSFYDYALRYDIDHKETRKVLGFKKKGKEWVASAEGGVPTANTCKAGAEREMLARVWEETKPVREKSAEALFKFVDDKKLDRNQRLIALHHVLLICDSYERARAVLNHVKVGDAWVSKQDEEAANARAGWASAAKVAKVEEKTPYEEKLGLSFAKYRGERALVHVYAGKLSESMSEHCAQAADASFVRGHELLGLDLPPEWTSDATRYHFTVFNVREDFAKFVEQCSGIEDAAIRREAAASFGCPVKNPNGTVWLNVNNDDDVSQRDAVAHEIGTRVMSAACGWSLYWLTRGFGYYMSAQMMGSTKTTVFSLKSSAALVDSGGVNSLLGLGITPEGWRLRIARTAAAGKLATLTQMTTAQAKGADEQRIAQAFCMTEFLVTQCREKLTSFVKSAAKDSAQRRKENKAAATGAELQNMLLIELGQDEDEFNKAFCDWVLASYLSLPA
ncbi:MAG: hypothetical protein IT462_11705 [Planctomycetes bacterium]|nr:hypothetical protein [Planctomycetota bacterium]